MTNKEIQTVVMLEIVATLAEEPDTLPESVRTEIKNRFLQRRSWNNVFKPIEDVELRNKYIELFKALDDE